MPIFEFTRDEILEVPKTTFGQVQMRERQDLQRLLRDNVAIISPGTLIIAEEFGEWEDSRRRIDLLGIDREANLVVIELKRTEDGGHMDLQAIRYAAMVSAMTFQTAVNVYARYLEQTYGGAQRDARAELLEFLEWNDVDEASFAKDVRIVLAAAEFSRELTSTVLWLAERGLDIRCVRLQPYELEGRVLVNVQQIIPVPEAADYQVRLREKARRGREERTSGNDLTRYDLSIGGQTYPSTPKRRAIFLVFEHLVAAGHAPEAIAEHCGRRGIKVILSVEGEVGREEFIRLATEARAAEGRNFDPIRFFCDDGQLQVYSGRTYALVGGWSGPDWLDAMNRVQRAFPDANISFTPTD